MSFRTNTFLPANRQVAIGNAGDITCHVAGDQLQRTVGHQLLIDIALRSGVELYGVIAGARSRFFHRCLTGDFWLDYYGPKLPPGAGRLH